MKSLLIIALFLAPVVADDHVPHHYVKGNWVPVNPPVTQKTTPSKKEKDVKKTHHYVKGEWVPITPASIIQQEKARKEAKNRTVPPPPPAWPWPIDPQSIVMEPRVGSLEGEKALKDLQREWVWETDITENRIERSRWRIPNDGRRWRLVPK